MRARVICLAVFCIAGAAAAVQAASITQNADTSTIVDGNSAACHAERIHAENSYFRRFLLDADHGITSQFNITSVDIGVQSAVSGTGGSQPVEVKLHTIPVGAALLFANLTQIGTVSLNLPDQTLSVINVVVTGAVLNPTANDLVVEVLTPDGQPDQHSFFIGSNDAGQTRPSFIAAFDCMLPEPIDTSGAGVGFPDMHIVMVVTGEGSAPTGACCLDAVNCQDGVLEAGCAGISWHAGQTCAAVNCDPGGSNNLLKECCAAIPCDLSAPLPVFKSVSASPGQTDDTGLTSGDPLCFYQVQQPTPGNTVKIVKNDTNMDMYRYPLLRT